MGFIVLYREDIIDMENGNYYVVLGMTDNKKDFIGEIRNEEDNYSEKYTMSKREFKYWLNENGFYFDGYIDYRGERNF